MKTQRNPIKTRTKNLWSRGKPIAETVILKDKINKPSQKLVKSCKTQKKSNENLAKPDPNQNKKPEKPRKTHC